ncbi:MAG TPA: hypothetical protein VGX21_01765 [Methylomirabilota bacterium]|jgi:cellulose synthase/poly-beta-1,6-N-acetylglucosamine synthase-like glycosyltransferase|nr:hypothetical protein [Methylomirabilota bacterium]
MVTIVIPAKNEAPSIADVIEGVRPYADEILVVDGHSKTFKVYPSFFGRRLADDRAELTFRLFDHPKVWVFARAREPRPARDARQS